ncbi:hypothetical protein EYF80_019757 [Liparis tanakae]|uniref:Uncharacterized protein n=1 Tax=Liparis tanakae TaxID=230148 RepID=A0A4Z2HWY3_9TELE|nr:hypothetical protein EYF80_019757 [Liparis tanakae]
MLSAVVNGGDWDSGWMTELGALGQAAVFSNVCDEHKPSESLERLLSICWRVVHLRPSSDCVRYRGDHFGFIVIKGRGQRQWGQRQGERGRFRFEVGLHRLCLALALNSTPPFWSSEILSSSTRDTDNLVRLTVSRRAVIQAKHTETRAQPPGGERLDKRDKAMANKVIGMRA